MVEHQGLAPDKKKAIRDRKQTRLALLIDWLTKRGPGVIVLRVVEQVFRIITGQPIYRYSEIIPGVYCGGQHRPQGWDAMQERGITAVLNLRREHDDRKREICTDRYLYLPTTDNTPPSIEDLQRGVDFIGKELADGGAVYVHCGVGVGRAPTMVAAYLISQGMTPLQAWKHIRRIRPFIWPMRGQYLQIERYAEILREQGAELPTPKDEPSPVDLPEDLPVRETSPASTDR